MVDVGIGGGGAAVVGVGLGLLRSCGAQGEGVGDVELLDDEVVVGEERLDVVSASRGAHHHAEAW